MKKILTLTLLAVLFLCAEASTKVLIDWSGVNGAIRAVKTNYFGIEKVTNAYKNDYYVALVKVSNFPAGLYQCKKNSPKYRTNWKLVQESLGTNIIHLLPLNAWRMTNVTMMGMTNAVHGVITAELIVSNNSLRTRILSVSNASFSKVLTNAFHQVIVAEQKSTNVVNRARASSISNAVLPKVLTNAYHLAIQKTSTNSLHIQFTNSMSTYNSNSIILHNWDGRSNWILYVTNATVKIRAR